MNSHDTKILDGLRSGDEAALVEFLQTNNNALLAFIRSRIGSQLQRKIEPEDVLQEASMEAVRTLKQTDLSSWDPLNWLFQICERKIIDAHRRFFASQKRDASREAAIPDGSQAAGLADLLAASMTTPSDAFSRDQRQLRMLAALDTLPEDQREALRMRYLVGLSSKEIAQKLGKTDGATRVMISRALGKLHEMLAESE
jgi:RNA polymerase sigma-70 factor (ECF subfamily)